MYFKNGGYKKLLSANWLDDTNSFKLPTYVFDRIYLGLSSQMIVEIDNKKTFPALFLYSVIYYRAHIDQIVNEKIESALDLDFLQLLTYSLGIKNYNSLLNTILTDGNIIFLQQRHNKVCYKVCNFDLPLSVRVPKTIIDDVNIIKHLTIKPDSNRATGLLVFYKLLELFYMFYENWCLDHSVSNKFLNILVNSFSRKDLVKSYLNHFKTIKLLEKHDEEYKINIKVKNRWDIPKLSARDSSVLNLARYISNSLDVSVANKLYDLITRLRVNLFHLNHNRTGRFFINISYGSSVNFLLDKSVAGNILKIFMENLHKSNRLTYCINGKNITLDNNIINHGLKDDLWNFYDYRSEKVLNKFRLSNRSSPGEYIYDLINNNKIKIIPTSEGGLKIKFEKDLTDDDIAYFKSYGFSIIENNILHIPSADIFVLIEFYKRKKYISNSELFREYRKNYFLKSITEHINQVYINYQRNHSCSSSQKVEAKVLNSVVRLSGFIWSKRENLYRKCYKKLPEFLKSYHNLTNIKSTDFYFVVSVITNDRFILPEDCKISIEFNRGIVKDVDRRYFTLKNNNYIDFNYSQKMMKISDKNYYREYIGWVLLDKDIISKADTEPLAFTVRINRPLINGAEKLKSHFNVNLDFYVNYFSIEGNLSHFEDFWNYYTICMNEFEEYFNEKFHS